jgi:tetratricopeptide (TPR) repeat protein
MVAIGRVAPRRIRPLAILAVAVAVVATSYVLNGLERPATRASGPAGPAGTVSPAPVPPPGAAAAGPTGVGTVGSVAQIDHSIGLWTANLRRNGSDFVSATNLATLYQARARLTGNLDDAQRAMEAVATALRAVPTYAAARALEATIQAYLHDFVGALATATALYRDDPSQLGALAIVGDAQLEVGRYEDARATYAKLAGLSQGPAIDARLARLSFLSGDPDSGLRLARQARDAAVAAARADGRPRDTDLVFYHYQLGEMARVTGDPVVARTSYEAALAIRPDDLASLVGLARIDAADGDQTAAIAGLRHAAAIAPQPETLALLGDLLVASGHEAAAGAQYATVRTIRRLSQVAGSVYDRQLLLFELDHGGATEQILDQARVALANRSDIYGHDVVAWALFRLGRVAEARTEMAAALATGAIDPRLEFHAAAIDLAAGDRATGERLLRTALDHPTGLDPLQTREAEGLLGR